MLLTWGKSSASMPTQPKSTTSITSSISSRGSSQS
uniref:Uncharacterized protein n=1 Tax=Anguilla anguilla TaxID=7936 RepID=A0A0E9TNP2_ANGAN